MKRNVEMKLLNDSHVELNLWNNFSIGASPFLTFSHKSLQYGGISGPTSVNQIAISHARLSISC